MKCLVTGGTGFLGRHLVGQLVDAGHEVRILVRKQALSLELSGAEAVRIATINSARSLGLDDEFGSIETGKRADLVILDGDPLEDFRLIGSRVDALFMDGVLVIDNCGLDVKPRKA